MLSARRGGVYLGGGLFQLDRIIDPPVDKAFLLSFASTPGLEQTFTCVPPGLGVRMGVDRDEDGLFDGDELEAGLDPAAPWDLIATCPDGAVEGLAKGTTLHPVQQAFIEQDAMQCGFCMNGVMMTAKALVDRTPNPTDAQIRQAMATVLCRCAVHQRIFQAIRRYAQSNAPRRTA